MAPSQRRRRPFGYRQSLRFFGVDRGGLGRGGTDCLNFDGSESVGQNVRMGIKALETNKTTNVLKVGQNGTFGHDETKLNTWTCHK